MFTVTGTIGSIAYRVGVHDEPPEDARSGCVMGSTHVVDLLVAHEGDEVRQTPTHDALTLSLTDPASVLAYLTEQTNVTDVEGDVPTAEPLIPGAVY